MTPGQHTEHAFETALEHHLLHTSGYSKRDPENFNGRRCLDTETLLAFIKETQPKEWEFLERLHKTGTSEILLDELCKALDSEFEGCLNVLRKGFKCFGKTFRVAFFAPASGLNPDIIKQYEANRLTIIRQLHYSKKDPIKSVDVVLSLNGIPLVTAELKNPMTGQRVQHGIKQYRDDRDPKELLFQFKKRTLVHFAVDPDEVFMTTRLMGSGTTFLPFNKGKNGAAGNPDTTNDHKTAYLWEEVWQKDSFLDIIARFIQKEVKEETVEERKVKKESILFPRYHQLEVIRRLVADVREKGPGNNYLIQHSAGSGKSNSIGWLAHRLSMLHNQNDEKVFDSVIVITDRVVLDSQLQDTIYQFEHKTGVVERIDKGSTQLAEALTHAVPIIVTTLQKFPFVTEKMANLPKRKYAVIIDEAHSSQGGEMAAELKGVLSEAAIKEEAAKKAEEEGLVDYEEEIVRTMARRGKQPNISFFAFTATPKHKTIEVFGVPGADGKPKPFHVYSMRQAIEEKFILDVLKNYTTYKAFYKLIKEIENDPDVDKRKAAKALARFMTLHEHSTAQKTELIIEHFRESVQHQISGKAKAMLVAKSRLHAVRYKLAFDKYIEEKGYRDIKVLVAFSGKVKDPESPGSEYTEVQMNGGSIKESELRNEFKKTQYKFLIVAEKYQTGFNEPLLHTMYVDKRLDDVQAVQTLSRLNRRIPGLKEECFVLDFENDADAIREAFQPFYEQTQISEKADVRQLYDMKLRMEEKHVFQPIEVEEFAKVFFKRTGQQHYSDHARLNACLDPAVSRFISLEDDEKEELRDILSAFKSLYSFLSQIIPFTDSDLEKHYAFVRFLLTKIPGRNNGPSYDFENDVSLKYYRLQKTSEGQIKLESSSNASVSGPISVGTGMIKDTQVPLSKLIDKLNERFGTDFSEADQLFFESVKQDALNNSNLREKAIANTKQNFGLAFEKALEDLFIERMNQNGAISARYFDDKQFKKLITDALLTEVYEQIRQDDRIGR